MEHHAEHAIESHNGQAGRHAYKALLVELTIDFAIMYLVMYTMIATVDHFQFNLNTVYMTLMMVAPMTIIMLVAMRSMFPSRRTNVAIGVGAALVFAASFVGMRTQAAIGDKEFVRSMIPHHSGAILMCQRASLSDPEIVSLCDDIVTSQRAEIEQMERILRRLK
jgi:uncharacterized protein (DUF305 family)